MGNQTKASQIRKYLTIFLALLAVVIHVGQFTVFTFPSSKFYACHVLIGLLLVFINKPLGAGKAEGAKGKVFLGIDLLLMLATIVAFGYVLVDYDNYVMNMQNNVMTTEIKLMGFLTTILVLEASRRMLGNVMGIVAIVALIYAHFGYVIPGLFGHRGYSWNRILLSVFSDRGVFGTPIATSANNVYLFLLFAALLAASGADKIFQDIAFALAGRKRGGPAKMAVIASCLFGTISGSCVANVVSTGAFTIPLMKRSGYRSEFAGAVESVASTGGQIMPPIMGAAAFVMAEVIGMSYGAVCLAAALPALMYYVTLFKMVDLEAVKYNLSGLPEDQLPDLKKSLTRGMKLFIPVAVLLFLLIGLDYTPMKSAIWANLAVVVCGFLDREQRMTLKDLLDATIGAAKSMMSVVAACATAGIVVCVFSTTGLGLKFSNFIISMGGSSLILSLVLTMIVCAILGMGLPTTAAYIVVATAIGPALVTLGLPKIAAHLFLLYYASLSAITPPVAVASYAAAGIAECNPMRLGWTAVKLGITGFILPFAFALNTDYIMPGFTFQFLMTILSSITVCYCLACFFQGFVEQKITWLERILYLVAASLAIFPYLSWSLAGISLFLILYVGRTLQHKKRFKKSAA